MRYSEMLDLQKRSKSWCTEAEQLFPENVADGGKQNLLSPAILQ